MNDLLLIFLFPLIILIFCLPIVILGYMAHPYHEQMRKMVAKAFSEIDSNKDKYNSNDLEKIELWKNSVYSKMERYTRDIFPKQKRIENLKQFQEMLNEEVERFAKELKQPFMDKGIDVEKKRTVRVGSIVRGLFLFCCSAYAYLLTSSYGWGIFLLSLFFAEFCFPNGIPDYMRSKFNPKHFIIAVVICILGYFLNEWTYAQAEDIQIAVTVGLPIIYGLIYYALKHKKTVREI